MKPAFCVLEVRDTGPGMSRESAGDRPGNRPLQHARCACSGLYGERQKFDLSEEDGLVVILRIPLGAP